MLNRSNFTEKVMFQQRSDRNELGTYLRKRVSRSFQQVKSPEAGVCLTCLRRRRWVWLERRGVEGGEGTNRRGGARRGPLQAIRSILSSLILEERETLGEHYCCV